MMEDIDKCMKMISKDSTESTYQQIEQSEVQEIYQNEDEKQRSKLGVQKQQQVSQGLKYLRQECIQHRVVEMLAQGFDSVQIRQKFKEIRPDIKIELKQVESQVRYFQRRAFRIVNNILVGEDRIRNCIKQSQFQKMVLKKKDKSIKKQMVSFYLQWMITRSITYAKLDSLKQKLINLVQNQKLRTSRHHHAPSKWQHKRDNSTGQQLALDVRRYIKRRYKLNQQMMQMQELVKEVIREDQQSKIKNKNINKNTIKQQKQQQQKQQPQNKQQCSNDKIFIT